MADEVMIKIVFACSVLISACVWILNPLTIAAIVRSNTLRTTCSNICLLNLAVADLLLMTVILLTLTHRVLYPDKPPQGPTAEAALSCFVRFFAVKIFVTGSVMSSFAIAVDRFFFIFKPLRYPDIVTIPRVVVSVILIWLVSLANSLVPFFRSTTFQPQCEGPYIEDALTTVSMATTGAIFVSLHIISSCMYIKMFFIIRHHKKVLQSFRLPSSCASPLWKTTEIQEAESILCDFNTQPDQDQQSNGCSSSSYQVSSPESASASAGKDRSTSTNSNSNTDTDRYRQTRKSPSGISGNDVNRVPEPNDADEQIATAHWLESADDDLQIAAEMEDQQEPMIKKSHNDSGLNQKSEDDVFKSDFKSNDTRTHKLYLPSSLIRAKKGCAQLMSLRPARDVPVDDNSVNELELSSSSLTCAKRSKSSDGKRKFRLRDLRTIKSLLLMGNLYFLCWGPVIIVRVLTDCFQVDIDRTYFYGLCIFGLANPIFNFIVFPLQKVELRNTIKSMLASFKDKIRCTNG